ncbi:MAG: hypothetical protein JSW73_02380 [Candidatus Woesearchaeota archaeon]|nr:MAG: hypothetical protein JSW73_02380 [Candidatus Woesearchaeota archaeon]
MGLDAPAYFAFGKIDKESIVKLKENRFKQICKAFGYDSINKELNVQLFQKKLGQLLEHEPNYNGSDYAVFMRTKLDIFPSENEEKQKVSLSYLITERPFIFGYHVKEQAKWHNYLNPTLEVSDIIQVIIPLREAENLEKIIGNFKEEFNDLTILNAGAMPISACAFCD